MSWFDKLERKWGRYAIKNLMLYVIAVYAVGFIVISFWPDTYYNYLSLDVSKILQGQVWRIVTFVIQPPNTSIFWIFISLYFYYFLGTTLERTWGAFKFNVYYFSGIFFTVLAAFIIYFAFDGLVFPMSIYYINMALFLAFAVMYSDMTFLLFFIIPIKAKWLAYFDGAIILAQIVFGYAWRLLPENVFYGMMNIGIIPHPVYATEALVSILNFIVFMLMTKVHFKNKAQRNFRNAYKQTARMQAEKNSESDRKTSFKGHFSGTMNNKAVHKCAVCGRTEIDNPELEFRFCSKCYSNYEYCNEHLYTHKHVSAPNDSE